MEGQEEFQEILKAIPGTREYEFQIQAEIIRQNQIEINRLKNQVANRQNQREIIWLKMRNWMKIIMIIFIFIIIRLKYQDENSVRKVCGIKY